MNNLYNNVYRNFYGNGMRLFEDVTDLSSGNTKAILKMGSVKMYDDALGKIVDVDLKTIVKAVNSAFADISVKYDFLYEYIKKSKPMYVLTPMEAEECVHPTMSVDSKGNLWMNVHFIYNKLNCDKRKIMIILFHELMHHFLDHMKRSKDVFPEEKREDLMKVSKTLLKNEMTKQNLCMDFEVNCNMTADGICSPDFWDGVGMCFDEKYYGKMWEEIYATDGDKLLKKYIESTKVKLPERYFEIVKGILEAMKVLRDKEATDKDKDIATAKLKDLMLELFGDTTETKMTIRKRLKKLQKTNIKEVGEIGPLLKNVIDDLMVSPKNMSDEDISKFSNDVDSLKKEMLNCVGEISKEFGCPAYSLPKDIEFCMDTLKNGVIKINKKKDITAEEMEEITREVIYSIDRLLADNIKKKKLEAERAKWLKELEKKKEERMEKLREKAKRRHMLRGYLVRLEDFDVIYEHERMSEKTYMLCEKLISNVEKLTEIPELDKVGEKIKEIGLDFYKNILSEISESIFSDLMELKKSEILWDREESFFRKICDDFKNDSFDMFETFTDPEKNETEISSSVKIGIFSLRKIGREYHRQAKVRASEDYKEGYTDEYKRLRKIYMEFGEKGLRKELGLPSREEAKKIEDEKRKETEEYLERIKSIEVTKVYWNVVKSKWEKDDDSARTKWFFVFGKNPYELSSDQDWNVAVYQKIIKTLSDYNFFTGTYSYEAPVSQIMRGGKILHQKDRIENFKKKMKEAFPEWGTHNIKEL